MKLLFFFLALQMQAAITGLNILGSTQTQAGVQYIAPTDAACSAELSESPTYTPLVNDVNTTLFPGSDLDSRAGNVTRGRERKFIFGKQGKAYIASNGLTLSRALRAYTRHYGRITCGGDQITFTLHTANLVMGDVRGNKLDVAEPFKYNQVSQNPILVPNYIDPYTGVFTRQVPELFGWSYNSSTGTMADQGISSDCQKTLAGFDNGCLFTAATGTNWTPTSSTLTDAVRTDDSNYAEYSGTTQDWLELRLGTPRQGDSTTVGAPKLSFQAIGIKGNTSTTDGDGEEIETCLDMDREDDNECDSPILTTSLTTSDSVIWICQDSPCSTPDNPGDWMTYNAPDRRAYPSKSRMYNVAGSLTTMRLTGDDAVADCNRLKVGETFYIYNLSASAGYTLTVNGSDCGASPPTVSVAGGGVDITHTGTTGVGFWRFIGINSENYSLRIRKKSTTSGSTIKIGYVLWRAAWGTTNYLNDKSGGFGQPCQQVPTNDGYYLCGTPKGIVGFKPRTDNTGFDYKYYGTMWLQPQYFPGAPLPGIPSQLVLCRGYLSSFFGWDLTTPGKFYCNVQSDYPNHYKAGSPVDSRPVVVALQMSLEERTGIDPDWRSEGIGPAVGISSATNLTPCINGCTTTADDFTPYGQAMKFTAGWTYPLKAFDTRHKSPSCGMALDANTIYCTSRQGSSETPEWLFAFDLGNGLPVGAGFVGTRGGNTYQIFAAMDNSNTVAGRHCAVHTAHYPVTATGAMFIMPEVSDSQPATFYSQQVGSLPACATNSQNPASQTCTSCSSLVDPENLTLDGYDYTSTNLCSLLTLTSTWPSGSPDPSWGYETGDPVNASGINNNATYYFNQKWRRGDFMRRTGEVMRIIQRNSSTEYVVIRGWGTMASGGSAPSASDGTNWGTTCYNFRSGLPTQDLANETKGSIVWYPLLDPVGGYNPDYTFLSIFHNHAQHSINFNTWDKWRVGVFDFNDTAYHKSIYQTYNEKPVDMRFQNSSFAGKVAFVFGNAIENHPGAQHTGYSGGPQWFHDINPRLFHAGLSCTTTWTLVSGKSSIFQQGGCGLTYMHPKHYDIDGFTERYPLKRVDTLLDGASGRGTFCVAIVANDCFSGSTPGLYMSSDIYDIGFNGAGSQKGCFESEFGGLGWDGCIGDVGFQGVTQTVVPNGDEKAVFGARLSRIVKTEGMVFRPSSTINAMSDPAGVSIIPRDMPNYVVPPPLTGLPSQPASNFRPIRVDFSGLPSGSNNALVQFGYDGTFACTRNRDNTCYAESATLNEATPFQFDHETLTGVSCTTSCAITIPALANRVLYYRKVVRNASGTVLSTGPTEVMFVN